MGALGPVFRAQGGAPGQLIAIKAFKLDVSPELAPAIAAALRELVVRTPALVGLVPLVDAALEGETPWLAMDHLAWPTLDTRLREGRLLPLGEALAIVRALAQAVDAAHGEGLLHGSLHPRDVFLTPDGVVVSGFGVAAALGVAGLRPPRRRPFTAPETLAQKPLDAPADRYALGVLAYEIVSGRRLLGAGDDLVAGLAARADTSDTSRAATALAAMLAERPEHRPSSAGAFAQALCAALESPPPGATAVTTVAQAPVIAAIPAAPRPRATGDAPPAEALAEFARQGTFWEPPRRGVDEDAATVVAAPRPALFDDGAEVRQPAAHLEPEPPAHPPTAALPPREPEPPLALAIEAPPAAGPILDVPLRAEPPARADAADTLLFRSFGDAVDDGPAPAPASAPPPPDPAAHTPPLVVLALMLGLGLAVGGAGGYLLGVRSGERAAQRALGGDTGLVDPPSSPTAAAADPVTPAGDAPATVPPSPVPAPDAPSAAAATAEPAGTRPRPGAPAATGQLSVRSTPSRAGVVVDGTWRGRTPLTVRGLTPGTHAVRVVQDGYVAETRRVAVDARGGTTVSFQLERVRAAERPAPAAARPAAKTGSLRFDSRPSGAAVYLDGRLLGTTPLQVSELEPRAYQVRLELTGHRAWTTTSTVVAGQQVRVAASLEESQ